MAGVTVAEIDAKYEKILALLNDIATGNAKRDEQIKGLLEDVAAHKLAIDGNGKPGLKTELEMLKQRIQAVYYIGGIILVAILGDAMTRILTAAAK